MIERALPDTLTCRAAPTRRWLTRAIASGGGAGNEEKCPDVLYGRRPEP